MIYYEISDLSKRRKLLSGKISESPLSGCFLPRDTAARNASKADPCLDVAVMSASYPLCNRGREEGCSFHEPMRVHNHGDKANAPQPRSGNDDPREASFHRPSGFGNTGVLGRTHNGGRNTNRQETDDGVVASSASTATKAQHLGNNLG